MTYFAVIDTNVVVSAMLKPNSYPGTILKYALIGVIVPLVCDEIVFEYECVIKRDKFGFDKKSIDDVMSLLLERSINLDKTHTYEKFIDEKDIVFYEIALSGKTIGETYLITGNIKHFPKKPFIVAPKEMVEIIESN